MYDITDENSFGNVKQWLSEIDRYAGESVSRFVVGNKSDLDTRRAVSTEDGRSFAESLGVPFLETSAKNADNVSKLFVDMAREIRARSAAGKQGGTGGTTTTITPVPQKRSLRKRSWC